MNRRFRALSCFFAFAILAALSTHAAALAHPKKVQKRADAKSVAKSDVKTDTKADTKIGQAARRGKEDRKASTQPQVENREVENREVEREVAGQTLERLAVKRRAFKRRGGRQGHHVNGRPDPETPPLSPDLAAVKQAFDLIRRGKTSDATALEPSIGDPVARKLVEWQILHHPDGQAGFSRYAAFIADNPSWPAMRLFRRRAEARLWQERSGAAIVAPFVGVQPVSGRGQFALARVLLAQDDRSSAERLVRDAWRSQELTERVETEAYETFHDLLTRDDHRARMDKRIGAKDYSAAMRAAHHLGDDDIAIVKACAAVTGGASKALDLLDAVAADARQDLGYTLCRARFMMRKERYADAARVMLAASPATMAWQETDEWWRERRVVARKLLDLGDFRTAYEVVREAALPANENYQAEARFLPGWIALRYLDEPATARELFAHIDDGSTNPIVIARANYWRGRAAEAIGETRSMRGFFEAAASHPTAYYGQLARAKLGLNNFELRQPPQPDLCRGAAFMDERVHAAEMLYAIGERDLVRSFVTDFAEESADPAVLVALGELAYLRNDAPRHAQHRQGGAGARPRARLLRLPRHRDTPARPGRSAGRRPQRGLLGRAHRRARSTSATGRRAKAVGLMQVTPKPAHDIAKRIGVAYDREPAGVRPGLQHPDRRRRTRRRCCATTAARYVLTFAGYNAGRGRVKEWIERYGDPRDPKVDPVDWVERIPFSRDPQLRPARDGEHSGLSRPLRRRRAGAAGTRRPQATKVEADAAPR